MHLSFNENPGNVRAFARFVIVAISVPPCVVWCDLSLAVVALNTCIGMIVISQ